jgi:hypothetical protein
MVNSEARGLKESSFSLLLNGKYKEVGKMAQWLDRRRTVHTHRAPYLERTNKRTDLIM